MRGRHKNFKDSLIRSGYLAKIGFDRSALFPGHPLWPYGYISAILLYSPEVNMSMSPFKIPHLVSDNKCKVLLEFLKSIEFSI